MFKTKETSLYAALGADIKSCLLQISEFIDWVIPLVTDSKAVCSDTIHFKVYFIKQIYQPVTANSNGSCSTDVRSEYDYI